MILSVNNIFNVNTVFFRVTLFMIKVIQKFHKKEAKNKYMLYCIGIIKKYKAYQFALFVRNLSVNNSVKSKIYHLISFFIFIVVLFDSLFLSKTHSCSKHY